jgi:penicillin-binding protein 1A
MVTETPGATETKSTETLLRRPAYEPAKPRSWPMRALIRLYKVGIVFGVVGAICAMIGFTYFSQGLMSEAELRAYEPPLATQVMSGDGTPMTVFARERRAFVPYDQIPKLMVGAILSAEDKTFFSHSGLDYPGIAQAMLTNYKLRGKRRPVGASTITQQEAKNLLGDSDVAIARKIREMILALRMERVYTKERILELYLNQIFLGKNSYGIAAAAKTYFNKSLNELSVEEFAFLASLPKAPNNYDPVRYRDRALQRRNMILDQMVKNEYISAADAEAAKVRPIAVNYQREETKDYSGDYFLEEVRREAIRILGDSGKDPKKGEKLVYEGGLAIRATIDPRLQQIAEKVMRNSYMRLDRRGWHGIAGHISLEGNFRKALALARVPTGFPEWRGAVVTERTDGGVKIALDGGGDGFIPGWQLRDMRASGVLVPGDLITVGATKGNSKEYALKKVPEIAGAMVVQEPNTGRVLAMVGGFDSRKSQFNRATQAMRQPGSSFKPFVYAAAMENGMTPSSIVVDGEFCVWQNKKEGKKCFRNFSAGRTYGPQTLRTGLELSRNLMTVRLADKIGMKKVSGLAEKMGIYGHLPPYLAMALGSGETTPAKMVNGYAMFANNGKRVYSSVIESIQDRRGKIIWKRDSRVCAQCDAADWTGLPPPDVPDTREQVINPWTAYQVTHMLEGVITRGTGKVIADLNRPLAGKTGTTTDAKDVWFIGMSPDMVAGLYIGYDKPRPMNGFQGGTVAAPIFKQFMSEALKDAPKVPFRLPDGIRLVRVDARSGKLASGGGDSTIYEAFKPGTEPLRASQKQSVPVTMARTDAEFQSDTGGIY